MLSIYPACFFKESNGYSVIFPDLNYLATCGSTIDEALEMAVDCLAGYIHSEKMEGDSIPEASGIQSVDAEAVGKELDIDATECFVNLVTVDVDEYSKLHFEKPVKKTLTIPSWLNDTAQEKNINFSAVLQEALKAKLRVQK